MDAKIYSEIAKNWGEVLAIAIGGGGYFLYRASRGAFTHNLSLSVKCRRKPSRNADRDYLAVTVNISKGERYTVELHDAAVKVSWQNGEQILTRVSPLSEETGNIPNLRSSQLGIGRETSFQDVSSKGDSSFLKKPPG